MKIKINKKYHVPYIAGYNLAGTIIYIDSRVPDVLPGTKIKLEKYLLIHELTEQHLEDTLKFDYQSAHHAAEAAEMASFEWDGHGKHKSEYLKFYKDLEKLCRLKFDRIPADLDLEPYIDSKDNELLKRMKVLEPSLLIKG